MFLVCHAFLSVHFSIVVTCLERADLLAPLFVMFYCVFVTFPCGILGQVWCLIVFTVPRWCFFCGSFLLYMFLVCHAFLSVHCSLVVTCLERADLLALLFVMFYCAFVTFPCGILGQVWCLIVLIPDLCLLSDFAGHKVKFLALFFSSSELKAIEISLLSSFSLNVIS